jgi:protocatechuate 3,4-dioxygenase beta subunit
MREGMMQRRRFLLLTAGMIAMPSRALAQPLTPACGKQTAPQTAGPFFKPSSPMKKSFVEDGAKSRLLLSGRVLSRECKPVPGALLDFWHADEAGDYDNDGFRYRGHQHATADGRYRLETVMPGEYPGRTRHIHVNVQVPGGRVLTTQLYFPGEPGNARDALYRRELEIWFAPSGEAAFEFVVEA